MYPHFMCIGTSKSGTTWLYANLKDHPQVWLPPVKEIQYFSTMVENKNPHIEPLFRRNRWNRRRLAKKVSLAMPYLKKGQFWGWYFRYFFLRHSDEWYRSLFSPKPGQLAGDLSPGYDIMDEAIVQYIANLMPNLKIIYLMRNPVERTWSHAAMRFRELAWLGVGEGIHTADEETLQSYFDKERLNRRVAYLKNLDKWGKYFPKEQIFVGFFEQITQEPQAFLTEIQDFLEIESTFVPTDITQKVNAGKGEQIPERWARYLAQRYHSEVVALHQHFNNSSTARWLAYSQQYL